MSKYFLILEIYGQPPFRTTLDIYRILHPNEKGSKLVVLLLLSSAIKIISLVFLKMYIHRVISVLKPFSVCQSLQNKIWAPSHSHCASNSLTLCLPVLFGKLSELVSLWHFSFYLGGTLIAISAVILLVLNSVVFCFFYRGYTISYLLSSSLFSLPLPFFSTSVQFSSVAQSCPTLRDPMNRSTPGLPVSYTMSQTSVHGSSGTLSIRSRPLNLFLTSTV